jgi:hypothetical protein
MLKLEHIIQYRCLRIALDLMQSTQVETLEVIAAVEPLRMLFSMLNQRYLTKALIQYIVQKSGNTRFWLLMAYKPTKKCSQFPIRHFNLFSWNVLKI